MTPTQRQAIELAISDFEHISAAGGRVEFVERRIAALRAALAEPAPEHAAELEPTQRAQAAAVRTLEYLGYTYHDSLLWKPPLGKLRPAPVQEPVAWRAKDANGRWMYGNLPAPDLPADAPELLSLAAPKAQQPAPPADVPMLTQKEIDGAWPGMWPSPMSYVRATAMDLCRFAANIQVRTRQKAGLK